jgi:hypothetical protein
MKQVVHSKLRKTDWGLVIDFPHRNGDVAHLDYSGSFCGSWKEVDLGKEYDCEVFYSYWHAMTPQKSNKNWFKITGDAPEELLKHSHEEILKYSYHFKDKEGICYEPDENGIFPWFYIRKP